MLYKNRLEEILKKITVKVVKFSRFKTISIIYLFLRDRNKKISLSGIKSNEVARRAGKQNFSF